MPQDAPSLLKLITDFSGVYGIYSWCFLGFFASLLILSTCLYLHPSPAIERRLFWLYGSALVIFTALRPLGIAIDDSAYIEISRSICAFSECLTPIQSSRDFVWYGLVGGFKSFLEGPRAILALAAVGLALKLYVLDRLSSCKLLALTLFIPLVYLSFDFTIFRAGLALSFYFLALYLLVQKRKNWGNAILLGNGLIHTQAIFSVAVVPLHWLTKYKKVCLAVTLICLTGIYLKLTPSLAQLSYINSTPATPYLAEAMNGGFLQAPPLAITYLVLLAFTLLIIVFEKKSLIPRAINQYVIASALVAVVLAWFFAPIMTMQSRLFDFYIAPLVFLVGNLERNKWAYFGVIALAIMLYARLELLHNFILG
jgi:hypothetical protein